MSEQRKSRLDDFVDRPKRAVWVLAAPMMAGFTVHALYTIVDTVYIGRLGPDALAAVTFVAPLFFVAIALGNGLATGVTAVVAQAVGRRDHDNADHTASSGLGMGMAIGLVLCALGLISERHIMGLLGASGVSVDLARQYFQVLCFGMPLMFTSVSIRAVLNGEGDAKTPMMVLGVATLINLILDPIFIFAMDLGIRGAAMATVVAQMFSLLVFCYLAFFRKSMFIRIRLSKIRPYKELVMPIINIGLPATLAQFVMAAGMMLINRVLAEFGTLSVAGYGAASKIDMIVILPILGLAGATVGLVGMFAGAGRADLVRSSTLYAYRWAIVIATSLGLAAFFASETLVGLFIKTNEAGIKDPKVIKVGCDYLSYMVFAYPMVAFGITSGRILQGIGKGMPSLFITALRVLVIGVPFSYIAVYVFDASIKAVWLSFILGGLTSNILALYWVRKYVWKMDPTEYAAKMSPKSPG